MSPDVKLNLQDFLHTECWIQLWLVQRGLEQAARAAKRTEQPITLYRWPDGVWRRNKGDTR